MGAFAVSTTFFLRGFLRGGVRPIFGLCVFCVLCGSNQSLPEVGRRDERELGDGYPAVPFGIWPQRTQRGQKKGKPIHGAAMSGDHRTRGDGQDPPRFGASVHRVGHGVGFGLSVQFARNHADAALLCRALRAECPAAIPSSPSTALPRRVTIAPAGRARAHPATALPSIVSDTMRISVYRSSSPAMIFIAPRMAKESAMRPPRTCSSKLLKMGKQGGRTWMR